MSIKRRGFKLSTLSLAIMATASFNAAAFEEAKDKTDKKKKDAVEVIEVTGFRGSVMKSMNAKRFSENVSDSIYAEDIGKSTDQNIADALSRVTGVSVQSTDGEGTKITVRGANPNQNVITMNGVTLTSSDENQSVDLSTFSSDILSHINVIKTPSADHDEGSLGATVQLNTTKPLDVNKNIRTMTAQYRFNDFSEESDYKISGTISEKFLDESFGVLFTAYDETSSVRRDQLQMGRFEAFDVDIARDLQGNIVTDTSALVASSLDYSLFQNKRDRHGATLSFQYLPTDTTNINLDLIYGKQELVTTDHRITVRTLTDNDNYVEGVPHLELSRGTPSELYAPEFSDPQEDWWTMDTKNRTLVKTLNRFADGGYGRTNGGDSTTNTVVNLSLEQYITDDFKLDVGVNYSKSHLEPVSTYVVNLQGGKYGKQYATEYGTPHTGIQPAGYDCTSGSCIMVGGDGYVSQEDPYQRFDGLTSTAFNPEDFTSQGTNTVRIRDREIEDEQKTAFVDFDWEVDYFGVTKVEFGYKASERTKYVDNQEGKFENAGKAISVNIYDNDGNITGSRVLQPGQSLGAIPATNYITGNPFPVDNFMQDLGIPVSNVTDGWPLISASKLLELANTTESLAYTVDPSETREATLKNQAAYIKFSFEPMDNLTGDVGVRWVRTEVEASGYSGVNYFRGDPLDRVFDPFLFRQLRNTNNPECIIANDFPNDITRETTLNRIDGIGWDYNGTPDDYSDDTRFPGNIIDEKLVYPCYDPLTEREGFGHFTVGRHADVSHSPRYYWGESSDPALAENRSVDVFKTEGTHEYDLFLPSLNLNYQVNDDIIARFAVSKTMSRPNIDSLKPGFKVNEGIWGADYTNKGSNLTINNTQLQPQESKNLDLSFEWYFNESGMFSTTLFHKDMSNFEEQESLTTYLDDLRFVDPSAGYDSANLIKSVEQINADFNEDTLDGVGSAACFPDRGNIFSPKQDWWYSENLIDLCKKFNVTKIRNGKGATIMGTEISYNQTYDFLPGLLSGLGTQVSYTYTDSETDAEQSSIDPTLTLASLPSLWTAKHTYNGTVFWEKFGHQIRLSYRGKSDELINRNWNNGNLWREGSGILDLSINYKVSEGILVSFQAINLTDETTRNYFTSSLINLGDQAMVEGELVNVPFDEGNVLENGGNKSRTQLEYKTGRTFRLGVRVNF
ncbi:MAG: TonB-dependent receptor [Thalassotalea sp.]